MDATYYDPCHRVDLLVDRCHSLYNRMSRNPDRPSWELEYLSILIQLSEIFQLLDSKLSTTALNLEDLTARVSSLEKRYSELLYKLSSSK